MDIERLKEAVIELNGALRIGPSVTLVGADDPAFTIVMDPNFMQRLSSMRTIGDVAEAYLSGDLDIEGDMIAAARLRTALTGALRSETAELTSHTAEEDEDYVKSHYDLSNDFYRLFLDDRTIYSCAYFSHPSDDINDAQWNKLRIISGKLGMEPGHRVLDIGCGWGGPGVFFAKAHGAHVDGITLSDEQLEVAQQRAKDVRPQVNFRKMDYREIPGKEVYDRIVSIGMAEHVGRQNLGEVFFPTVERLLKPDGLYLHHVISWNPSDTPDGGMQWMQKRIFPGAEFTTPGEAIRAAEASGLYVRHYADWGLHYARTLRCWYDRLTAQQEDAVRLTDARTVRRYRLYLAGCAEAFEAGRVTLSQFLFSKNGPGRPELPFGVEMAWT